MIKSGFILFATILCLATSSFAAGKEYQVTGPVVDNTDSAITIQKGKDVWEIKKDGSTKAPATVAKGDKVTVYYTMSATTIEGKAAKAPKKK